MLAAPSQVPTQIESKEPSTSFVSTGAGGTKPGYLPIGVPVVILPYEQAGDAVDDVMIICFLPSK